MGPVGVRRRGPITGSGTGCDSVPPLGPSPRGPEEAFQVDRRCGKVLGAVGI